MTLDPIGIIVKDTYIRSEKKNPREKLLYISAESFHKKIQINAVHFLSERIYFQVRQTREFSVETLAS